jgi:hypothetical protein
VDIEACWFSHGGVTIQPNLMDLAIDYLRRGEIKHALRALYNNFGASLYPDVRAFAEHPVVELGHGVGPFYKSSDESKALVWLRHHLLHEEGHTLHVAIGAPSAWFAEGMEFGVSDMATFFGPVSFRIHTASRSTGAEIELTPGREPIVMVLHLRLPGTPTPQDVRIDGASVPVAPPTWESSRLAIPSPAPHTAVEVRW